MFDLGTFENYDDSISIAHLNPLCQIKTLRKKKPRESYIRKFEYKFTPKQI